MLSGEEEMPPLLIKLTESWVLMSDPNNQIKINLIFILYVYALFSTILHNILLKRYLPNL